MAESSDRSSADRLYRSDYAYLSAGFGGLLVAAVLIAVGYMIATYKDCAPFGGGCSYPYDGIGTEIALVGAVLLVASFVIMATPPRGTRYAVPPVVCKGCGRAYLPGTAKFCPACGEKLPES
ncbi:MAG TPA: hypothetical protein VEH10_06545 [Thermoplasmata archaeon]|nr:hypothetical protein [Thermoplasmata archaeon]